MSREFSIEEIQQLMKGMAEHKLSEISYECEGVKLKLKSSANQVSAAPLHAAQAQSPTAPAAAPVQEAAIAAEPEGIYLTSPIVGTFYSAPSPDKEPFAVKGQKINKGDTAFIIESMKVMNEVPSDFSGTVAEILVENGQPVEFGQNILRLE